MNAPLSTLILSVVLAAGLQSAHGQSGGRFSLNWHTPAGGHSSSAGLTSAGGVDYAVTGTVGQPAAAAGTAGTYTLEGGFLPAFQKAVGPPLVTTRQANDLSFTWPASCLGFVLEGAENLDDRAWDSFGEGTSSGGRHQLRLRGPLVYRFFRLRKDCPQ